MLKGLSFGDDELNKFLGPIGFANLLVTRAQVDMAVGRYYYISIWNEVFVMKYFSGWIELMKG